MNLKIACTSCYDRQPSRMHTSIACFIALLLMLLLAKVKVDVFSAVDMDHCSSQLKSGEHPGPSTHKHKTDPHSPPAHADSDTNMHPLANTYKKQTLHTNMYPLT